MPTINRQYQHLLRLLNVSTNNFQTVLSVLMILLCGTLSFSWFEPGEYLAPTDLSFPFSSSSIWYAHTFTWDERFSRESVPGIMRLIPYLSFVAGAEKAGLNSLIVERLLFYFLFTFPGLAAYYLTHTLLRDKAAFPGLLAALFYMMNPLTLLLKWNSTTPSLFAYGMMPLLLALYIVGIRKQSLFKYPLLFGVASLLGASATTISYFVSAAIPIIGYFLFSCMLSYRQFSQIVKTARTTFFMAFSYLLFNFWWILPFLLILSHRAGLVTSGDSAISNFNVFELESAQANLMNLIRGQGYWAFHKESQGIPYYPFASSYLLSPMIMLSFLVPAFGILGLMRKAKDAKMVFLGFLFIVGIILTSGIHPPFGDLNAWFFQHIPGYAMFRIIPDKFGPLIMLPLAVLYGVGAYESLVLFRRILPRRVPRVVKSVIVLLPAISIPLIISGFYMFPFWTGELFERPSTASHSLSAALPSYYSELGDWINGQQGEFKLLNLPPGEGKVVHKFSWGYRGDDPVKHFVNRTVYQTKTGFGYYDELSSFLWQAVDENFEAEIVPLLQLMNVRYVLIRGDLSHEGIGRHPSIKAQVYFEKQKHIEYVRSFGPIAVYEIQSPEDHIRLSLSSLELLPGRDQLLPFLSDKSLHVANPGAITYKLGDENVVSSVGWEISENGEVTSSLEANAWWRADDNTIQMWQEGWINLPEGGVMSVLAPSAVWEAEDNIIESDGWDVTNEGELTTNFQNKPNATVTYRVTVEESGDYDLVAWARHDGQRGTLGFRVDDQWPNTMPFYGKEGNLDPFQYGPIELGEIFLDAGSHEITVINSEPVNGSGYQNIDRFLLSTDAVGMLHLPWEAEDNIIESDGWDVTNEGELTTNFQNKPNATVTYRVTVEESGDYDLVAWARHDGQRGTLGFRVDDQWPNTMPFYGKEGNLDPFQYGPIELGEIFLDAGSHEITVINSEPVNGSGYQNIASFHLQGKETIFRQDTLIRYQIEVPREGEYSVEATLGLSSNPGTLRYRIDGGQWSSGVMPLLEPASNETARPYLLGIEFLAAGVHMLEFSNAFPVKGEGEVLIYSFGLRSIDEELLLSQWIDIPVPGMYQIAVTSAIDDQRGTLKYKIDEGELSEGIIPGSVRGDSSESFDINLVALGEEYFDEGKHLLTFTNGIPANKAGYQNLYSLVLIPKDQQGMTVFDYGDKVSGLPEIITDDTNVAPNIKRRHMIFQDISHISRTGYGWQASTLNNVVTSYVDNGVSEVAFDFTVPEDSVYSIFVDIHWDGSRGSLQFRLNDDAWSQTRMPLLGDFGQQKDAVDNLMNLGDRYLLKGNHVISFRNTTPVFAEGFQQINAFFLVSQESPEDKIATLSLKSEKINPTHYLVELEPRNDPSLLILSESFHHQWKAFPGALNWWQTIFSKPIPEYNHLQVNTYANSWLLEGGHETRYTLYFLPQAYFYLGLIISVGLISLFVGGKIVLFGMQTWMKRK